MLLDPLLLSSVRGWEWLPVARDLDPIWRRFLSFWRVDMVPGPIFIYSDSIYHFGDFIVLLLYLFIYSVIFDSPDHWHLLPDQDLQIDNTLPPVPFCCCYGGLYEKEEEKRMRKTREERTTIGGKDGLPYLYILFIDCLDRKLNLQS